MLVQLNVLAQQVRFNCLNFLDPTLWPNMTNLVTNMTSGMNNLSSCAPYQTYVKSEGLDFDTTLASIENYFGCSGIC
jgi:hypothetical protein